MASEPEAPVKDQPPPPEAVGQSTSSKQTVDPWNVAGAVDKDGKVQAIDYNKLIEEFGTRMIDDELLERFEKVVGVRPHHLLRRGIFFSHRDLHAILDRYEKKEPFFLYTSFTNHDQGRGPSSDSMHIGHAIPFTFTKWLSDVLDVPLVIMMTDDEKFLFSENRTIEEVKAYTKSNAKDILAIGFAPERTFIFSDYDYMGGGFYETVSRISKRITYNVAKAAFGFNDSSNIGKIHFAAIQAAAAFATSFPHIFPGENISKIPALIPCAVDQDPYFRLTRDVAAGLRYAKPSLIHARFLDGLSGPGSKMSASIDSSAIFLNDTPKKILNKINKYAFSGGQETAELQRELGGNPDVDVSYQYLKYFLEDDEELAQIAEDYRSGKLLTGELKKKCSEEVAKFVTAFQERRSQVTDETVELYMSRRKLQWRGAEDLEALASRPKADGGGDTADGVGADGKMTKNQMKKLEKMRQVQEKKAAKAKEKEEAATAAATS